MLKTRGAILRGRDAVADFVREISDRYYETVAEVYRPVDDTRIVVEGRIRWTDEDNVMRDDPVIWALEFKDGLLYRSTPVQTLVEGESILAASRAAESGDEVSPG